MVQIDCGERDFLAAKATSGLPGLSPVRRFFSDKIRRNQEQNRLNLLAELEREQTCAAPVDGETDTTNLKAQLGRPLESKEVERRLGKCNSRLLFERSISDDSKVGVYVVEGDAKRFVCGMEFGYMPEFSVRHIEKQRIPDPTIEGHWREVPKFTRETRGWRTVLARLLRERLITESQVESQFEISAGRSSYHWQALTT